MSSKALLAEKESKGCTNLGEHVASLSRTPIISVFNSLQKDVLAPAMPRPELPLPVSPF
jgi:hypothetical protein